MPQLTDGFKLTVDAKELKQWADRLAQVNFIKREKVSIGVQGTIPLVPIMRTIAKVRKLRDTIEKPTQYWYRGGIPRFGHVPGNLRNAIRRTPRKNTKASYFAWIGVALKDVTPFTTRSVGGRDVPIFGKGNKSSYAPYAYKAYGDDAGSSYSNWQREVLQKAINLGGNQAFQKMIARALALLDKKTKNV